MCVDVGAVVAAGEGGGEGVGWCGVCVAARVGWDAAGLESGGAHSMMEKIDDGLFCISSRRGWIRGRLDGVARRAWGEGGEGDRDGVC